MTDKQKFHQLICLYELAIICYSDYSQHSDLSYMEVGDGMCNASKMLFDQHDFPALFSKRDQFDFWWPTPSPFKEKRTNLRALQVRLDWLYEQLNKLK